MFSHDKLPQIQDVIKHFENKTLTVKDVTGKMKAFLSDVSVELHKIFTKYDASEGYHVIHNKIKYSDWDEDVNDAIDNMFVSLGKKHFGATYIFCIDNSGAYSILFATGNYIFSTGIFWSSDDGFEIFQDPEAIARKLKNMDIAEIMDFKPVTIPVNTITINVGADERNIPFNGTENTNGNGTKHHDVSEPVSNAEVVEDDAVLSPGLSVEDYAKMANDIFISPYHTTIGSVINVDKVRAGLLKYLATTQNTLLNYEFIAGGVESTHTQIPQFIIITGCDEDERQLPIFDHPIIARDLKGKECVCVDARKYIKTFVERPADIMPLAKDPGALMFVILRGLITVDFLSGKQYYLSGNKVIAAAYGMFMGNIIASLLPANPIDKMNIEYVATFYANALFYPNKELPTMVDDLIARVANSDFGIKANIRYVSEIIGKINVNARTLPDLIENIKIVVGPGKASLIDKTSVLSRLVGLWFGPGENTALGMATEHLPTWIALLYSACADRNFKKSRFALMLDKNSKQIKPLEFEKFMSGYILEHKHEEL